MTKPIVICADYKYLDNLYTLLKSLYLTFDKEAGKKYSIFIVTINFPVEILEELKSLNTKLTSKFVSLDIKHIKKSTHRNILQNIEMKSDRYSREIYDKLFISQLLDSNYESCLYLDADTLVIDDISYLLDFEVEPEVAIYAAQDHLLASEIVKRQAEAGFADTYLGKFWQEFQQVPVLTSVSSNEEPASETNSNLPVLFNAGVMILNLKKIREQYFELYQDYLVNHVESLPHDALFLNLMHKNDWKPLPDAYNFQVGYILKDLMLLNASGLEVFKTSELTINEPILPKIVHFAGLVDKLYSFNLLLPFRRYYYEIKKKALTQTMLGKNDRDDSKKLQSNITKYPYIHFVKLDEQGNYLGDLVNPQTEYQGISLVK